MKSIQISISKKSKIYLGILGLFLASISASMLVTGCNSSSGSSSSSGNAAVLTSDQMPSVPLVEGTNSNFNFYITNAGNNNLNNLNWSIKTLAGNANSATILDQSDCNNILAHSSCHLVINASSVGSVAISGSAHGKTLSSANLLVVIKKYELPKQNNLVNAITFSSQEDVHVGKDGGALNFFLVNNNQNPIVLSLTNPLGKLPQDVKLVFGQCTNPIPQGGYCQLRLHFSYQTVKTLQQLYVPLHVNAHVLINNKLQGLVHQNNLPTLRLTSGIVKNYPQQLDFASVSNKISLRGVPGAPVINPVLDISANSLFGQTINQAVSTTSSPYVIQMTNNSTESDPAGHFAGDPTLFIPYQSLMPANSGSFTYSVNGNGLANPCVTKAGAFPTSGQSVVLQKGNTCSYNLYITTSASAAAATVQTVNTAFQYYVYSASSPYHPTFATISESNGFTASSFSPSAVLTVSVASSSNINAFSGVILGSASPSMTLDITNTGNQSVTGSLAMQNLPAAFTSMFGQGCSSLAPGSSCTVLLTMSTGSLISGNLSSAAISYGSKTANLPSVNYSVLNQMSPPTVTEATSVTGCYVGNGVSGTCFNNPDNMGGNATQMQVKLNFTNTSTTAVTSLAISSNIMSAFTNKGYTLNTTASNCNLGIAANGGTCQIIYDMPSSGATAPLQTNITDNNFVYTSTYGPNASTINGNTTLNLAINVVVPVTSFTSTIGAIVYESGILIPNQSVSLMVSNLYQNLAPTLIASIVAPPSGSANGITVGTPTCNLDAQNNVATCTTLVSIDSNVIAPGKYNLNIAAYSGSVSANLPFNLVPPTIFMTRTVFSAQALGGVNGADNQCMAVAATENLPGTYKALLVSPGRYPCDATGLCGVGHSSDWPFSKAGTKYYNTNSSVFNTVTSNLIFDGSNSKFFDEKGVAIDLRSQFWFGAQSIHVNSTNSDIDGWAYSLENSANPYNMTYNNIVTSCNNFSGAGTLNKGAPPSIGIVGTLPQYYSIGIENPPNPANSWGGWSILMDNYSSYLVNVWVAEKLDVDAQLSSCETGAYHLVCVSQF